MAEIRLVRVHNFKDDPDGENDSFHGPFDIEKIEDQVRLDVFLGDLNNSPLVNFCSFAEITINDPEVHEALAAQGMS